MNEHKAYKTNKAILLIVCCCALLLSALIGAGITKLVYDGKAFDGQESNVSDDNKNETAFPERPNLNVLSKKEDGDLVIVNTTYGTFSYPFVFSDILSFEVSTDDSSIAKLNFYADINESKYILFTLNFGSSEGVFIGQVKIEGESTQTNVSVVFYDEPEGLNTDELTTYYAAKELFNDIEQSLMKNDNYSGS